MSLPSRAVRIISIHALLAESDNDLEAVRKSSQISIHALLAESDPPVREIIQWEGIFLSTLSLRRATISDAPSSAPYAISIHALLAESDGVHYDNYNLHCVISIHALLAESDPRGQLPTTQPPNFYPRSPCGERRQVTQTYRAKISISIHALLAESDSVAGR